MRRTNVVCQRVPPRDAGSVASMPHEEGGSDELRPSEIARCTGMSMRYWQRRAANGDIPGTRSLQLGKRRAYLVRRDGFAEWWATQLKEVKPCPIAATSRN